MIGSLVQKVMAGIFIDGTRGEKLNFWENAEDRIKTERRKAWEAFIANNRKKKIYVDPEVAISRLSDEINDMEKEVER